MLVTTWKTPGGWIVVRDALTMGPRDHEDEITPHTRPPADDDGDHMLVRTVDCLEGRVEVELVCEPVFDYGRAPAEWTASTAAGMPPTPTVRSRRSGSARISARDRGQPGAGAPRACGRATRAYCALSWAEGLAAPQDVDEAEARLAATTRFWRDWLGARPHSRPPLPRPDPALGARDQGPDLHADRCDGGGTHHVAPRDAGR